MSESEQLTGRIVRMVEDRGFGFIKGDNKREYFFNARWLSNAEFSELTRGQRVRFVEHHDASRKGNGFQAHQVEVIA